MDGLSRPKMFGLSHMLVARKSLEDLFKLGHLELVTARVVPAVAHEGPAHAR